MICNQCPRKCNINRKEQPGVCLVGNSLQIALCYLHKWEEPCICSGNGSGAIFLCGCNLKCVFCQNAEISKYNVGKVYSTDELITQIKELENNGACNINFVSPTQYSNQIVEVLKKYKPNVPIVWNSNGFELVETIEKVAPFVDIFLPDFKYVDDHLAEKYSSATNYVEIASKAIKKMIELKPNKFDKNGNMTSGVIVRHMILPNFASHSCDSLQFIHDNFNSPMVSLLSQFTPHGDLSKYPELNRKITKRELEKVIQKMNDLGLSGYVQEQSSADSCFIPKWNI